MWGLSGGKEMSKKYARQTVCKPGSVPASANRVGGWPFIWDARYRTPRATYPGGGTETCLPD